MRTSLQTFYIGLKLGFSRFQGVYLKRQDAGSRNDTAQESCDSVSTALRRFKLQIKVQTEPGTIRFGRPGEDFSKSLSQAQMTKQIRTLRKPGSVDTRAEPPQSTCRV